MNEVTLDHGSGGKKTKELIENLFYKYFQNEILAQSLDANLIQHSTSQMAISTDSFVVDPLFFKGGDIGKLSICGTVNDLAMSGATPKYLTVSFILEEGLSLEILETVVKSMANIAKEAQVQIVAGDTKVVEAGKGDKIYINTTGIGFFEESQQPLTGADIEPNDVILISGTIADHGMAILSEREFFQVEDGIESDCAPLHELIRLILNKSSGVKFLRDPTRGGLATTLKEVAELIQYDLLIYEDQIPIKPHVKQFCQLLGINPLYVANEGKVICVVAKEEAKKVLEAMHQHPYGKEAKIIGIVQSSRQKKLFSETTLGALKELQMMAVEQLPRIC